VSLRQELLPDVRVTLIEPGAVATELPKHITHEETRQSVQQSYGQAEVTADDPRGNRPETSRRPMSDRSGPQASGAGSG
jgi:short-subunit dehydrogenase